MGNDKKHNFKIIDLEKMNQEEKASRGYNVEENGCFVNRLGLSEQQMLIAISEIETYMDEMCGEYIAMEYIFFPFILTELILKGKHKELDLRFTLMEMVDEMIEKLIKDPTWPYHGDKDGYRQYMYDQLVGAIKIMLEYNLLSIDEDSQDIDFKISFKAHTDLFGDSIQIVFAGAKSHKPIYQELSRRGMRVVE